MIHYLAGTPARGESFYNREYQIKTILDGRWTWICGQMRIGNTSLLFQLEIEAEKRKWLPLFLNLTTLEEYSGKGLVETFLLSHRRTLKKHGIRKKDFSLEYPVECFYQLISDLAEKETQVMFLWDEAEKLIEIEENDPGILNKIRARLSRIRDFRFVISGTQLLSTLYVYQSETVSSFLHTFHWKPLPVLEPDDAKALLRCDQTGGWSSPLPTDIINKAVRWSGGHPLMLHELGIHLSEKTRQNGEIADTGTLQRCFNDLQKNINLKDIIRDDYAKLTDEQQQILRKVVEAGNEISFDQLATGKTSPDKLTDSLHFLENYSYITWDADGFILLRFIFYPEFLQFAAQKSVADAKKVNQIRRTIFIAYSHKDQKYFNDLKTHLVPLVRKDEIDAWDDKRIETDESENVEKALTRAQVVVFLVSPDFLNTRFMAENDSPKFIAKANMKGCKILNLFVRPSVADKVSFKIKKERINLTDFQGLNLPDKPLSNFDDNEKDEILSQCASEVVRQTRIILSPDPPDNAISDKNAGSLSLNQNISKGNMENKILRILHLSDIHLDARKKAGIYLTQLSADLELELKVDKLDYVVLSGDVANHSTPDEYKAAFDFLTGLAEKFSIDPIDLSRFIPVPGNHDLNWNLSRESYVFKHKDELPQSTEESACIPAGETGTLLRDEKLYKKRFAHFNRHFYKKIHGKDYPLESANQGIIYSHPHDRILFFCLNTCWEIDHFYKNRASINSNALSKGIEESMKPEYQNWFKIAVWHHPINGPNPMQDDFMQLLTVAGFKVCMHGHIHEAKDDYFKYDSRGIHIIGSGTFGAPAREQVTGIPLQYHLVTYDKNKQKLTVETRKKEKPNGAWSADARWGDKNNPVPRYTIDLNRNSL